MHLHASLCELPPLRIVVRAVASPGAEHYDRARIRTRRVTAKREKVRLSHDLPVELATIATRPVASADELAMTAASVGLASNLSALRALATEGIQRGHMSLHARSVASAAGALGDEVELIAARIAGDGLITVEAAQRALSELRRATP